MSHPLTMDLSKKDGQNEPQLPQFSINLVPATAIGHLLKGVKVQQLNGMEKQQMIEQSFLQVQADAAGGSSTSAGTSKEGPDKPELYLLPVTLTTVKSFTGAAAETAANAVDKGVLQSQASTSIIEKTTSTATAPTTTINRSLFDDGQLFSTEADIRPRRPKHKRVLSSNPNRLAMIYKPNRYQVSYLSTDSKVIIALLLAMEVEHFRATDFEEGQRAVIEQFRRVTEAVPPEAKKAVVKSKISSDVEKITLDFNDPIERIVKEVERFSEAMDDQQAQEVVALFENCLFGLSYRKPIITNPKKKTKKDDDEEVEEDPLDAIGNYLVGLTALLNAHFRLRPAASAALEATFSTSSNVSQLVSNIAQQLRLISVELLQLATSAEYRKRKFAEATKNPPNDEPLQNNISEDSWLTEYVEPYRHLVLLAVGTLRRIFSIDYIPGLGEKVGEKALGDLLNSLLPFWVLRMRCCRRWAAAFYVPIEDFGDSHLFCGREECRGGSKNQEDDINLRIVFPEIASPGKTVNVVALFTAMLKLIDRFPIRSLSKTGDIFGSEGISKIDLGCIEDVKVLSKTLLKSLWRKMAKVIEKTEKVAVLEREQQTGGEHLQKTPKHLFTSTEDSATLENLFCQLYWAAWKNSGISTTNKDFFEQNHLDSKLIELGTGVTEKLLRYLATCLGDTIWNYLLVVVRRLTYVPDRRMFDFVRSLPNIGTPPSELTDLFGREFEDTAVVVCSENFDKNKEIEACGGGGEEPMSVEMAATGEPAVEQSSSPPLSLEDAESGADKSAESSAKEIDKESIMTSHPEASKTVKEALENFSKSLLGLSTQMFSTAKSFIGDLEMGKLEMKNQGKLTMNDSSLSVESVKQCSSTKITVEKEAVQTAGKRFLEENDEAVVELISLECDTEKISLVPKKEAAAGTDRTPLAKKVRTSENQLSPLPQLTTTIKLVTEADDDASNFEKHSSEHSEESKVLKSIEVLGEIKKMQEKMNSYREWMTELLKKIEAHKK